MSRIFTREEYRARFGKVVNRKPIGPAEYDAILARFKEIGKSDQSVAQIAAEFDRGVTTIERLRPRA